MSARLQLEVELPEGRRTIAVAADRGQKPLTELLRHAELPLNTRCGQRGLCDGCFVTLVAGTLRRLATDEPIEASDPPLRIRGCEHRLADAGPVRIRILPQSRLAHQPQVVTDFKINVSRAHVPLAESGLGWAIDVGTTTVAALLVDLTDGTIRARAAGLNRQAYLGDDVLTRINLCMTDPTMLDQMQESVVGETLQPLFTKALREAEASVEEIGCMVVAGNATMLHLLAGVDPSPMGVAPFTAAFLEHRILDADAIGLSERRNGTEHRPSVHLLPGAAAYVGADLIAGVVASGLIYDDGPSLLVDVGTNGEIILKHEGRLFGCATAAGPAFEGAGLICGMRAADGAIAHVRFESDPPAVRTEVIGDGRPIGLCGSAYVDFLAEGRRVGLLSATGRLDATSAYALTDSRATCRPSGLAFRVACEPGADEIVVSETDIAGLLQAKAAIGAGILTLLHRVGLTPADVRRLYLAGGFGLHLNPVHAIACGLLPGFAPEQVRVVGNTSLGGAYLALLDESALQEMTRTATGIEIVELNLEPEFEGCYIEQLALPD